MSDLLGGLTLAARALAAQQAGVQTAGRNLSNANTPGYARQRVQLGDRAVIDSRYGSMGTGVEVLGIEQMRDRFLDASVTREVSRTSMLEAQRSAYSRAEADLGERVDRTADSSAIGDSSRSTNGISSALNDFFNGWEELSAKPTDSGARQVLLQRAATLTDKFNVADQRLAGLQTDLTAEIDSEVSTVNSLLGQIATLNGEIGAAEVHRPGSANDLRDQRQLLLEKLAQYTDYTARPLAGSAGQIEILARDAGGGEFALVQGVTVHGGLSFNGTGFTSGVPPVALALQGGALAGNLTARDGAIAGLRADLRRAADQLAGAVNNAYNPGGAASDFFQVPPANGIIAVAPGITFGTLRTSATADPGANELALAVGDVARQTFSTVGGDLIDGTVNGFLSSSVSGLGATLAGVNARLSDQQTIQQMVTVERDSVSGVAMDEEMADLIKYQRAYEASARVLRTLDEMLDTLVNQLGR